MVSQTYSYYFKNNLNCVNIYKGRDRGLRLIFYILKKKKTITKLTVKIKYIGSILKQNINTTLICLQKIYIYITLNLFLRQISTIITI